MSGLSWDSPYLFFDNFAVFSQYQYQYRYQYSIFFNINIKIKILDLKISRSRSISIFWKTWIQYQDQDQHDQYIEKYWKINILSHPCYHKSVKKKPVLDANTHMISFLCVVQFSSHAKFFEFRSQKTMLFSRYWLSKFPSR